VFAALVIQHAVCMRHFVTCGLPDSTMFPHYLTNGTILEKRRDIEHKNVWFIFSTTFV
jgi:hypothetical protein